MYIDLIETKKVLDASEWNYELPTDYLHYELLETECNVDEVAYWLNKQSISIHFLKNFYLENQVEIEDYIKTLEATGEDVDEAEDRIISFLEYFADTIAQEKMKAHRVDFNVPDFIEFILIL